MGYLACHRVPGLCITYMGCDGSHMSSTHLISDGSRHKKQSVLNAS